MSKVKKILKCPDCNEFLEDELQEITLQAFAVMMSPIGRYLEFNGTPFLCKKCHEKEEKK